MEDYHHCHNFHCQIKEMIGEADKDDSGAVDFGEI